MHWIVVDPDSVLNTNEHWKVTRNFHQARISNYNSTIERQVVTYHTTMYPKFLFEKDCIKTTKLERY